MHVDDIPACPSLTAEISALSTMRCDDVAGNTWQALKEGVRGGLRSMHRQGGRRGVVRDFYRLLRRIIQHRRRRGLLGRRLLCLLGGRCDVGVPGTLRPLCMRGVCLGRRTVRRVCVRQGGQFIYYIVRMERMGPLRLSEVRENLHLLLLRLLASVCAFTRKVRQAPISVRVLVLNDPPA